MQSRSTLCYCSRCVPRSSAEGSAAAAGAESLTAGDAADDRSSPPRSPTGEPWCLGPFCLGRTEGAGGGGGAAAASAPSAWRRRADAAESPSSSRLLSPLIPRGRSGRREAAGGGGAGTLQPEWEEREPAAGGGSEETGAPAVVGARRGEQVLLFVAGTPELAEQTEKAERASVSQQRQMAADMNEEDRHHRKQRLGGGAGRELDGRLPPPPPDHLNLTYDFSHFEIHGLQVRSSANSSGATTPARGGTDSRCRCAALSHRSSTVAHGSEQDLPSRHRGVLRGPVPSEPRDPGACAAAAAWAGGCQRIPPRRLSAPPPRHPIAAAQDSLWPRVSCRRRFPWIRVAVPAVTTAMHPGSLFARLWASQCARLPSSAPAARQRRFSPPLPCGQPSFVSLRSSSCVIED